LSTGTVCARTLHPSPLRVGPLGLLLDARDHPALLVDDRCERHQPTWHQLLDEGCAAGVGDLLHAAVDLVGIGGDYRFQMRRHPTGAERPVQALLDDDGPGAPARTCLRSAGGDPGRAQSDALGDGGQLRLVHRLHHPLV
jgi:hypothetical protein